MSALTLNKVSLNKEKEQLETYSRFLPSLELKREQLFAERAMASRTVAEYRQALNKIIDLVEVELPMLANEGIDLSGLATVQRFETAAEKRLGLRMPFLAELKVTAREYSYLAKPHWVDEAARRLKSAVELAVSLQLEISRLAILEQALNKVTQRINLFEQVLIPETRQNVKTIAIALSDAEKAGVVRAKIAKRHRQRAVR